MRSLAKSLSQTFGVGVSYPDKDGNRKTVQPLKTFALYWAPEGKKIATVTATTASAAKRKAPMPYRKYLGEIRAEEI